MNEDLIENSVILGGKFDADSSNINLIIKLLTREYISRASSCRGTPLIEPNNTTGDSSEEMAKHFVRTNVIRFVKEGKKPQFLDYMRELRNVALKAEGKEKKSWFKELNRLSVPPQTKDQTC